MISTNSVYLNIFFLTLSLMFVTWLTHKMVEHIITKETLQKFYATSSVIFQVLGSVAGIMQAFVVVSFWNDFQDATNSAHHEVENVTVTYRNISLLTDSPQKAVVMTSFKNYVVSLVTEEVTGHAKGLGLNDSTQRYQEDLWQSLKQLAPAIQSLGDQAIYQALVADANNAAKLRQHRVSAVMSSDATLLWVVLIGSALLVMLVMGMLSMGQKGRLYYLQSFALAFIFSLMIAVSLDYSKPYEGTTTISKDIYEALLVRARNLP
jgi:hypothetical protein